MLGVKTVMESLAGYEQEDANTVRMRKQESGKIKSSNKVHGGSSSHKNLFQDFKKSEHSNS